MHILHCRHNLTLQLHQPTHTSYAEYIISKVPAQAEASATLCFASVGMTSSRNKHALRGRAAITMGRREYQQDRLLIWEGFLTGETAPVGVYGVFDGHGSARDGHRVAQMCQERLVPILFREAGWNSQPPQVESALRNTTARIEEEAIALTRRRSTADGSTFCVVVVRLGMIWVCNVGDSRAVLSSRHGTTSLSADHHPSLPLEQDRIERAGGWVSGNRVCGMMAMSRSIGDRDLKMDRAKHLRMTDSVLTAEPDITSSAVRADDKFIILATDGLWGVQDYINSEWAELAIENFKQGRGVKSAAKKLMVNAIRAGSQDNVAVIVIDLHAKAVIHAEDAEKEAKRGNSGLTGGQVPTEVAGRRTYWRMSSGAEHRQVEDAGNNPSAGCVRLRFMRRATANVGRN